MARETSKPVRPVAPRTKSNRTKAKSRAANGFVMMAMALVTVALGIGLVLQAGLSIALSTTVAVAFYLGLLSLHTVARRHDQLDQLKVEIEHLKGEVSRLSAASPGGASKTVAAVKDAAADASAPARPQPQSQPATPAQSTPPGEMAASSGPAGGSAVAPATYLGVPQPPPPNVVRAPQPGNTTRAAPPASARAPRHEGEVQSGAAAAGAGGAVAGINRVPRNSPAAAPPAGSPPAFHPLSTQSDIAPLPSNIAADDFAPPAMPAPVATDAALRPAVAGEPVLPQPGAERDEAWTYRPGDEMQPRGLSPRETDVEMIQGLIKKLADEVNSADAGKLVAAPRRPVAEATLDQSVGALRRTAQTMKAPAGDGPQESAAMPQTPPKPAAKRPVPVDQDPPATLPPPEETEFDVDALMRRAQSIATMTSMPPPLPMAPNAMTRTHTVDDAPDRAAFDADTAHEVAAFEAVRREESGGYDLRDTMQQHELASEELAPEEIAAAADRIMDAAIDGEGSPWSGADDNDGVDEEQRAAEADARLMLIGDAIEAGRIDVFLEPILDLGKQQPRHYEVSLSLRDADGAPIVLDDDAEDANPSGALPLIDSLRLTRTAHVARRLEERSKAGSVFSTFSGQSLTSDDFLTTFADTYDANERIAGQLILTFSQADVRRFRAPHWAMVQEMRELGFGFAVRAVTDLDMDFARLVGAGFKFAKLDASVFLEGLPAPGAMVPAADICKYLASEGLALVVESIDDDNKRARVFGFGVLLGQGALFGGPRLMKAVAISGAQSAAA